jgi:serpin B
MVIALPDRVDGLEAMEAALTADRFRAWLAAFASKRVVVRLPKFVIEPGEPLALREHLEALGVRLAFDTERADLTGIAKTQPPLYLSNAFHKAYVRVDEEGTEAAAATAVVGAEGTGAPPKDLVHFDADHPFAFFVVDRRTEAIVFLGRVVDPVAPT